ncbi:hypothetical protein SLS56_002350 [Neofusicoccum ribis]|uniref:Uncharacterized protein n=1 Tax=Neofusicoccum ribis TaxID=45134 RepID=A0ABR3T432_9PEZI
MRRKATNTSESPIKSENENVEVTPEAEDTPVRRASSRKRAAKRYAEPGSTEEEDDNFETPESPTKKVKKEEDACFENLHATGGLKVRFSNLKNRTSATNATSLPKSEMKMESGVTETIPQEETPTPRRISSRKRVVRQYTDPGSSDSETVTPESPAKRVKSEDDGAEAQEIFCDQDSVPAQVEQAV